MKKPNWKDTTEMLGLLAIIASLIYLGYEMRQTKNIAIGESQSQYIETGSRPDLAGCENLACQARWHGDIKEVKSLTQDHGSTLS